MSSTEEGKGSCLIEFRSLFPAVETVLGEFHVLQCLTWYFHMKLRNRCSSDSRDSCFRYFLISLGLSANEHYSIQCEIRMSHLQF
jgi:hypothetical protein